MPSTFGIVIGIGAISLFLIALGRRARRPDLGSVSHTWVIENQSDRRNNG
jgi:hypothetical protein